MSNFSAIKRCLVLFLLYANLTAYAQIRIPIPSPKASVSQNVGLSTVTIEYYRPSLNSRKMMGSKLVPFGKVWRTGANKIPSLKTTEELNIAGKTLASGTYGIFTIPDELEWTVIISKNPNHYDANSYTQEEDVFRFKVKPEYTASTVEHFTIEFNEFQGNKAVLVIKWENTQIKFPIANNPEPKIMTEIKEKTSLKEVTTDTYYNAAEFFFNTDKDLTQALKWMDIVVEKDPQYWTYSLRAKIAAKLGNCETVKADVKKGLDLAVKANDAGYVTTLNNTLANCDKN